MTEHKRGDSMQPLYEHVLAGSSQCTVMLSPPAVEHDSDVCELETGGIKRPEPRLLQG